MTDFVPNVVPDVAYAALSWGLGRGNFVAISTCALNYV
jgi:hypothetical protein